MVSLQQFDFESIDATQSYNNDDLLIAVHRRSWTVISYSKSSRMFKFVQHSEQNSCRWNCHAVWIIPRHMLRIVAVLTIEAYDCFAFVVSGMGMSWIILRDLQGETLLEYELTNISDMVCADVDQQNREIFVGCKSGRVVCFYVHAKTNDSKRVNKSGDLLTPPSIHVTVRRQVRLTTGSTQTGGSVKRRVVSPVQIVSMDVLGFCLLLLADGAVNCYSSTRFDLLFEISADLFVLQPCRIWADKFGTDFVVQSRSEDGGREQLEFWTMPADYSSCEVGEFERVTIPLKGTLAGLCIESVRMPGAASFVTTVSTDQSVQLWRPLGDGTLLFEARVGLSLPAEMHAQMIIAEQVPYAKDDFFTGVYQQEGVFMYLRSSDKLPDSPVMFVTSLRCGVCKVGIHLPSGADSDYTQVCADIAIAQLQLEQYKESVGPGGGEVNFAEIFAPRIPDRHEQRPTAASAGHSGLTKGIAIEDQMSAITPGEHFNYQRLEGEAGNTLFEDSYLSQSIALGSDDGGGLSIMSDPVAFVSPAMLMRKSFAEESAEPPRLVNLDGELVGFESNLDGDATAVDPLRPYTDSLDAPPRAPLIKQLSNSSIVSLESSQELMRQMMSVDSGSVASYDPLSPLVSFHIDKLARASRELATTPKINSNIASVNPHSVFFAPQQYTLPSDITRSTSNAHGQPGDVLQLVSPFGLLIQQRQHRQSMQVVSRQGLKDGRNMRIGQSKFEELAFKLSSIAYRAGLFSVITSLKEVFVFNMRPSSEAIQAPLNVEFEIRQQAAATVILSADIQLQHPHKPSAASRLKIKSSLRKSDQVPVRPEADIVGSHVLLLVGDSDGRVHFAVISSSAICSFGVLRAHTAPLVTVLTTGDPVRPLWKVGSERSLECDHIVPMAVPGSGLVTMSKEGEVKTWQPVFAARSTKGRSPIDKAFVTYVVDWRLAGIFVVNEGVPQGLPSRRGLPSQQASISSQDSRRDADGTNSRHPDLARRIKGVESAAVDPTCMNVIVAFRNGFLEQWPIPGLVDTNNGSLATSQSAAWTNSAHFDAVHQMNVYVHASDTSVVEVDVSRENEARDEVIADLASYIRGTLRRTVGYTWKQMKSLAGNSSLVTSSQDLSVVLWAFSVSRSFASESSSAYLVPQPCRRFTFSGVPSHGVAFCTSLNVNNNYLLSSVWKLSAIVSGIVVTACVDLRSKLFVHDESIGSEHVTTAASKLRTLNDAILFEDEFFFEDGGGGSQTQRQSLPCIPAICLVLKPAVVVNAISSIPHSETSSSSWGLLDDWALVSVDRLSLCLHYDDPALAAHMGRASKSKKALPQSPTHTAPDLSATTTTAHFQQYTFTLGDMPDDEEEDEFLSLEEPPEVNAEGLQRFVINGIHMVADETQDPRDDPESCEKIATPAAKYSVIKLDDSVPARLSMRWSPEGDFAAGMQDSDYHDEPGVGDDEILQRFAQQPLSHAVRRTDFEFSPEHSFMPSTTDVSHETAGFEDSFPPLLAMSNYTAMNRAIRTPSPKNAQQLRVEHQHHYHHPVDKVAANKHGSVSHSPTHFSPIHNAPHLVTPNANSPTAHAAVLHRAQSPTQPAVPTPPSERFVVDSPSTTSGRKSMSVSSVSFSKNSRVLKVIELGGGVDIAKSPSRGEDIMPAVAAVLRSHQNASSSPKAIRVKMDDSIHDFAHTSPESRSLVAGSQQQQQQKRGSGGHQISATSGINLKLSLGSSSFLTVESGKAQDGLLDGLGEDQSQNDLSSVYSSLTEQSAVVEDRDKLTRSAKLRKQTQIAKKNNLDLLVKDSKEPVYTSVIKQEKPAQGVRQQLGKNSVFATVGKMQAPNQKVVIKKEVPQRPPPPSTLRRKQSEGIAAPPAAEEEEGVMLIFGDDLTQADSERKTPIVSAPRPATQYLPGAVEKVRIAQFTMDVPDNKMTAKRKNAVLKVVQNLDTMGAVGQGETRSTDGKDPDEESVISAYFDRAAPPIYAKKPEMEKKRLVSKRFDPPAPTKKLDTPKTGPVTSANLAGLADGFTKEERELFDTLDDAGKLEIIEQMKKNAGTKGGKKNNKGVFKELTAKLVAEALELAQFNMDVELEVLEVTDRSLSVAVNTVSGGNVIIVLAYYSEENPHPANNVTDSAAVSSIEGLVQSEARVMGPNSIAEVAFAGLRPNKPYVLYGIIDRSGKDVAKLLAMMEDGEEEHKEAVSAEVATLPELLDVEWGRLSEDMRRVEIMAATRSKLVQGLIKGKRPPISLPRDEDIDLSPATMEQFAATPSGSPWMDFLYWWAGTSQIAATRPRQEFLFNECLHAVRSASVSARYLEQKFCTETELEALVKYATDTLQILSGKTKFDKVAESKSFKRFRSWYKGGQVAVDSEEAEAKKKVRGLSLVVAPTMDDENVDSLSQTLVKERTAYLQSRIDEVEACKLQISRLVDGYRYAMIKQLQEADLLFKRAMLSPIDIVSIMCFIKLTQLCVTRKLCTKEAGLSKVDQTVLGKEAPFTACEIAAVDTFLACDPDSLKPDDPPVVDMACLPGTNRKPLKAWQLCSPEEKVLELTLACSLDAVLGIAIRDGMAVPDPEDAVLTPGLFPIRDRRWTEFAEWYAGDEQVNPIPGKGVPTLQRVVFAETTETRNVEQDETVVQSMLAHKITLPKAVLIKLGVYVAPEMKIEAMDDDSSVGSAATSPKEEAESLVDEPVFEDFSDTLIKCYERASSSVTGQFLRFDLMRRNIAAVLTCRRLSVMRLMWPPGPARLGTQYMFPRMGLLTPKYELPPKRIKLFPSRRPDSYSVRQLSSLYPEAVLENDDHLMRKAEADGVRLRAYYEWLTHEKERVAEGRGFMMEEDARARRMRETHKLVEAQLVEQADKLNTRASALDRDEVAFPEAPLEDFNFMHSVPKEYWYIFEESCEFVHGSGINNGDEVEELRLEEIKRANKAVQDAIAFENYLQEEKNRREMIELERLRKEETDRRLAEGVVRRRHLREHFEEQKRQRIVDAEEEMRRVEQIQLDLQLVQEEEQEALCIQRAIEKEAQRVVDENQAMAVEERLTKNLRQRIREMRLMEHEDILAFVREQQELRERQAIDARYAELQELYVPFEPFQFKHSRVKKPILHAILNTSVADEGPSELVLDLLDQKHHHHGHNSNTHSTTHSTTHSQSHMVLAEDERSHNTQDTSSSHHSHVENTLTSSSYNKRSERYKALYEGRGGVPKFDSTLPSTIHNQSTPGVATTSGDIATDKVDFKWHRHSHARPVMREGKSSPTKRDMRSGKATASGALSTYNSEWALQQDVSPACFVLTTKEPIRPLSGATSSRRSLAMLAPILEPLRDTSIFNPQAPPLVTNMDQTSHSENAFPFLQSKSMLSLRTPVMAPPPRSSPELTPHNNVPFSGSVRKSLTAAALEFNDSISFDNDNNSIYKLDSNLSRATDTDHSPGRHRVSVGLAQQSGYDDEVHEHHEEGVNSSHNTSEYSNAFSLFRSISQNIMVDVGDEEQDNNLSWDPKHDHKSRKKLKDLLASSAEAITAANEGRWLQFQQNQKKLVFASLTTIDSAAQHAAARVLKQGGGVAATTAAVPSTLDRSIQKETKRKQAEVDRLKQELKELGIVEESLLDFRTRQLAKSASESVMRMRLQRDLLKQYVSSGAVQQDSYYMLASEPGLRDRTSLEASQEVQRYVQDIAQHTAFEGQGGLEELSFLSNKNIMSAASAKKRLPRSSQSGTQKPLSANALNTFSSVSGGLSLEALGGAPVTGLKGNPIQLQQFQSKNANIKNYSSTARLATLGSTPSQSKPGKAVTKSRSTVDLFIKTPTSSRLLDSASLDGGASVDSIDTANLLPMLLMHDDASLDMGEAVVVDAADGKK